jgi:hypothetical protein
LAVTVISVVVGLVLAVAYHFASMWLQRWASQKRFLFTPLITILGFVVRIAIVVAILIVLGLWSPLNILAVCLSFIILFTVLNGIWLYSLVVKRRGAPPSAGATGVR